MDGEGSSVACFCTQVVILFGTWSLGASNIDKIVTKMPFVETLQYSNLYRIKEIRDEIDIIDDLV